MPSSGVSMLNETKGIPDPQTLRKSESKHTGSENRHTEIEDILFLWKFVSKDVTTAGEGGEFPTWNLWRNWEELMYCSKIRSPHWKKDEKLLKKQSKVLLSFK